MEPAYPCWCQPWPLTFSCKECLLGPQFKLDLSHLSTIFPLIISLKLCRPLKPETSIQPKWKVLAKFEKLSGGESGRTLHSGASFAMSMNYPVVSPVQNTTPMQQDPIFDTESTHDEISIALEDVPTGDMCTMDAMPQHPTNIQVSHIPGSQTLLPAPTQDPSCHFGTSSRGRQRTITR